VQVEIKHFLESVYGLHVEKVNTLNVEGKKKRGKFGFFRWALPACLTLACLLAVLLCELGRLPIAADMCFCTCSAAAAAGGQTTRRRLWC
jgi:hypothetical protein